MKLGKRALGTAIAAAVLTMAGPALAAWEPSKPVEFVVPAGTGGAAPSGEGGCPSLSGRGKRRPAAAAQCEKAGFSAAPLPIALQHLPAKC